MGIAAYNRGSRAITQRIVAEQRPVEFAIMDELNAIPKCPDAGQPFGPIVFQHCGTMWWALDPVKGFAGFGFCYPNLREAVRRWNVTVYGYADGVWSATPRAPQEMTYESNLVTPCPA